MENLIITFREQRYLLTALTSVGRRLLARYTKYALMDAKLYTIARVHPKHIRIDKIEAAAGSGD
jgi:hypothetical protein